MVVLADLMVVQILWLSRSYDCPDLMIVQYSYMLSFRSYGCPDLMVVHILWLSTSYGCPVKINILWLYLMVSYGCPMKMKILWFDLMVVHVDGCPVDGCPLTLIARPSRHLGPSGSSTRLQAEGGGENKAG